MARDELLYERLTESIIGAFYEVYNRLGYGFLEKVYSRALEIELRHRGFEVKREVKVVIYYRGVFICSQRVDLIVVNEVIVEVKAADGWRGRGAPTSECGSRSWSCPSATGLENLIDSGCHRYVNAPGR